MQKIICGMIVVLLMVSVFPLAFNIQLVKAAGGTIYIRADGSVDPSSAPILNVGNVSYTFTADINDSLVVERDNIVVDGAGYMLQGAGNESGISLAGRSNVTIKSIIIRKFGTGIYLTSSSDNTLYANTITNNNYYGIFLYSFSNGNSMSANTITNNGVGIYLYSSSKNSISANTITNNTDYGIYLWSSSSNGVSANTVTNNGGDGIRLFYYSNNNSISANNITNNNWDGIELDYSSSNLICHNNFVGNNVQAEATPGYLNFWDDGYPSGGNYWSNYTGTDNNLDGIGDTPYTIDANNIDHYPLMNPWTPITNIASLVIRRTINITSYRTYNAKTDSWTGWTSLSKATCDSPAATICNNELHMVIRDSTGNKLYHGYVNLANNVFSGWKLLSGSTPSAPTLTSNGTVLCLVIRGADNRTKYRVYSFNPRSWGTWKTLTRTTCDGPAAAMLGNNLHIITRSLDGTSLWHIIVKPNAGVVRNWKRVSGATPSKPVLTAIQTANKLYLVVRGLNNRIRWRTYDGAADSWAGWSTLPTGTTCDGPAATVLDNKLHIVIRSITGTTLRHGYINLTTSAFSGWTTLTGSTPSTPTLTS